MHRLRAYDRVELQRLLDAQRVHPPVDGLRNGARVLDLPLFIGDAHTAQDSVFLHENNITHVVSLGTGHISPERCSVLPIDILDMEDQLLVLHFEKCIRFLRAVVARGNGTALVHCVYGQSRSATICMAFLMSERRMSMAAAYEAVRAARPCIYINPGFLVQLQLFERMDGDANIRGSSSAHATLRALVAAQDRMANGLVRLLDLPATATATATATASSPAISCAKCNGFLGAVTSVIHGLEEAAATRKCSTIFLEPLKWMGHGRPDDPDFGYEKEGKLVCPKCAAKVGAWTWIGTKCQCGDFVSPAFQLVPSRIRHRK